MQQNPPVVMILLHLSCFACNQLLHNQYPDGFPSKSGLFDFLLLD